MSEENFGVPGFLLVEELGPEATEEIHQAVTDTVIRNPSTTQSSNTEFKVWTGMPIDLTENSDDLNEHHNSELTSVGKSETARNSFEDIGDLKDISVIDDDSFYHTNVEEGSDPAFRRITDERKSEPESTLQPEATREPVSFPKSGVLVSSGKNPEPVTDFKPKTESEFIVLSEGN
ncbi:hypothetical protein LOAG_11382 [Loa loa]|uniref:Uncharacterized protein n=1 Tax=Loa loa TaxID=7209 RepID=A0A1S0TNM6_LOALO|nr:hypothetical protein LOAG_11382 [Loa loa]EFO17117.2 hypothetical protein LOAG_11382 [Loa loa]